MNEAQNDAENIGTGVSTAKRWLLWVIFPSFLVPLIADAIFHRSALVDPIPTIWTIIGVCIGIAFGGFCGVALVKDQTHSSSETKRIFVAIGIVISAVFLGSYLARTAYEIRNFVGISPDRMQFAANVTGLESKYEFAAKVVHQSGRSIFIDVDADLFSALEPYRHPGRDCLLLPVEIGRGGVRRFVVPAKLFDDSLGIENLVECRSAQSI